MPGDVHKAACLTMHNPSYQYTKSERPRARLFLASFVIDCYTSLSHNIEFTYLVVHPLP